MTVLIACVVAGCGPDAMTAQEAVSVAKSHMQGEAVIVSTVQGRLGELAPIGLQVTDPNRAVWVVTLRGVMQVECTINPAGNAVCPVEPKLHLLVLDHVDGSLLGWSTITASP